MHPKVRKLIDWLERSAVAINVKRLNYWLLWLLALFLIGLSVAGLLSSTLPRD